VPRSPGGILPPGLVMRRHPCRRRSAIYPAWRLPAEDCDDFLSSLRSLRSRSTRDDCAVVQWGGIQPKETAGILPANEKGHLAAASLYSGAGVGLLTKEV